MITTIKDARANMRDYATITTITDTGEYKRFPFPKFRIKQLRDFCARVGDLNSSMVAGVGRGHARHITDDAIGMNFLVAQLAFVEATQIEKDAIPAQFEQLLGSKVVRGQGVHVNELRYQTIDYVGNAKQISRSSDKIPTADVVTGQKSRSVTGPMAIGYEYNVIELAESAFLQRPLDALKANSCRDGFQRTMNSVALFGKEPMDQTNSTPLTVTPVTYPGLFTGYLDDVSKGVVATTLVGGSTAGITGAWGANGTTTATTNDQILADFNAALIAFNKATGYNRWPNKILVPTTIFDALSHPMTIAGAYSVLEWLKLKNVAVQAGATIEFIRTPGLDNVEAFDASKTPAAGTNGYRRMIFLNDEVLSFNITQDLMFLAPQLEGLYVFVPGFGRCSQGMIFRRQNDVLFLDKI